jgi:hypothetical protein
VQAKILCHPADEHAPLGMKIAPMYARDTPVA